MGSQPALLPSQAGLVDGLAGLSAARRRGRGGGIGRNKVPDADTQIVPGTSAVLPRAGFPGGDQLEDLVGQLPIAALRVRRPAQALERGLAATEPARDIPQIGWHRTSFARRASDRRVAALIASSASNTGVLRGRPLG
ncbi:MAG: hypothetical protein AVDCRST_MAG67-179 [uncultured Solirubrobacteraceae bacterium]|uniref:Uncharacterized protein n=1 Tax=uncultured Solirubrobacteraceae bacterium TaxID=1162706 RepID=A0A6J4RGB4_9ACTN|nr:MAG: hypothetical protein AVDCRST_MAG67-179 [uncultured Solirubrobacteraceae bacterium]